MKDSLSGSARVGFRGVTDTVLESRGRKRRVVVSTQRFMLVPEVVAQTDIVAMMPSRLVNNRSVRLQIVEPPLERHLFDAWFQEQGLTIDLEVPSHAVPSVMPDELFGTDSRSIFASLRHLRCGVRDDGRCDHSVESRQ